MLIPIIKESERLLEQTCFHCDGAECDTNVTKHFIVSSQLALLEGLKKMYEGMKLGWETDKLMFEAWDGNKGDYQAGIIYASSQVIQSLEESITYLKSIK